MKCCKNLHVALSNEKNYDINGVELYNELKKCIYDDMKLVDLFLMYG